MRVPVPRPLLLTVGALVLAACGTGDPAADSTAAAAGGDTAATAAAPPPDAPGGAPADAPVTTADLDVFERALRAEIALVNDAVASKAKATTGEDSLTATFAALNTNTEPEAARQAGITVERYRQLSRVLGDALGKRQMNPGMQGMMAGMDTSDIASQPAEVQERIRQNMREASAAGDVTSRTSDEDPAAIETGNEAP